MSLRNAKPGDTLIVYNESDSFLTKVERTTKTRIFAENNSIFDRLGRVVPRQRWCATYVVIATAADIAEVEDKSRRVDMISRIADTVRINWMRMLRTDQLTRLSDVVAAIAEETEKRRGNEHA
jgi:hypothetical protein